jgi:hypothetical protein
MSTVGPIVVLLASSIAGSPNANVATITLEDLISGHPWCLILYTDHASIMTRRWTVEKFSATNEDYDPRPMTGLANFVTQRYSGYIQSNFYYFGLSGKYYELGLQDDKRVLNIRRKGSDLILHAVPCSANGPVPLSNGNPRILKEKDGVRSLCQDTSAGDSSICLPVPSRGSLVASPTPG